MVTPHTSWGGVQAAAGDQRCLGGSAESSAESNSRNHLKGLRVSNREMAGRDALQGVVMERFVHTYFVK